LQAEVIEENTIEKVEVPEDGEKSEESLTPKQKEILDLCKQLNYRTFKGKPVEEAAREFSDKKADNVVAEEKACREGARRKKEREDTSYFGGTEVGYCEAHYSVNSHK